MEEKEKNAEDAERATIIREASRDGKVIPLSADSVKTIPIGILREMVVTLPKEKVPTKPLVRPLSAANQGGVQQKRTMADAAEAINNQIARTLGEEFVKPARN